MSPWDLGYLAVGDRTYLTIVYDRVRFSNHVLKGPGAEDIVMWVKRGLDPPVAYLNGFLWVYSPGPAPDPRRYSK